MNPKKRGDEIQKKALDAPRSIDLDDLAKVAKRKRVTMEKYRERKLRMPEDVRGRVAAFLNKHADNLKDIATELRGSRDDS